MSMSLSQRRDESTVFSASSRSSATHSSTLGAGSEMFRVPPSAGLSFNTKNKAHKPTSSISNQATQVHEELNRLKFSRMGLYGRENELRTLSTFFEKMGTTDGGLNLTIVTGSSGTGKTALVKECTSRLARDTSSIVAAGKFDQHYSVPYGAFVAAFTQLCQDIPSHPLYPSKIQPAILEAVGQDYKLLQDLIPNICDLVPSGNHSLRMSKDGGPQEYDMVKSKEKFKFLLQRFLHAVCHPSHKVVLLLDDIQWMDSASLKLWETILSDSVLADSMWVIGVSCDEVSSEHVVSKTLDSVQKRRGKAPSVLTLEVFSLETTTGFISELLNLENVESLATIAHQRVQGNVFCLIQFLTLIRDKGFLHYDISSMKWTWVEEDIRRSTVVSNNVLSALMEKVDKLPSDAKQLLQVLTCLGAIFSEDLMLLVHANLNTLEESSSSGAVRSPKVILESLITEGLLETVQLSGNTSKCYCFSHSQIGIVAMEMSEDFSRLQFHVGRILWENQNDIDYQGMLFTIVDLWNGGKEHMHGSKQIRMLIDLNFQAGKKALESSAFGAATEYLHDAINLIPMATRWSKDYDLTLQLYNCLIKAEYSNGMWDLLRVHTEEVIAQKDRPITDKIIAYTAAISVLSIQEHNHPKAIDLAVHVLEQLGTSFWRKGGKLSVVGGLLKTKKLLSKMPLESLLTQKEMNDTNKLVALDILTAVNSSMYGCNPDLLMCSVLKTLRWSLKYGVSKDTAKCVSFYGLVEMALGNINYGSEACKLAIKLAEKENLMNTEYAPIGASYGFVLPWTTPMHTCSSKLLVGYNLGLETGDLHYGFLNVTLFCYFSYCCGKPFDGLESDMREYAQQMREYKQSLQLQFLRLTWQTILNLMGKCDGNPAVLSGEVMKYQEVLRVADIDKNPPLRAQVQCHRLELAVYFCDFNLAAKLIGPASAISLVNPGNPIIWRNALFEGVAAFELYRRGKKKWKANALKALFKTQKWVDGGNVNCVHILYLLQAEKAASMEKNTDGARQLFDKAIVTAARNGFRNDRALATERCAAMYESESDQTWFEEYFSRAMEAYREIGAIGKVEHMKRQRENQGQAFEGISNGSECFSQSFHKHDVDANRTISDLTGIKFPILH